jgi:hypothetical protein
MRRRPVALVFGLVLGAQVISLAVLSGVMAASAATPAQVSPTPGASLPAAAIGVTIGGDASNDAAKPSGTAKPLGGTTSSSPPPLAVVTAPATPVVDALVETANRLTLNHGVFHAGDTLTATGTGFLAAQSVRFVTYPGAVAPGVAAAGVAAAGVAAAGVAAAGVAAAGVVVANANGTVAFTFVLPKNVDAGAYTIEATSATRVASAHFIVASTGSPGSGTLPPLLVPLIGLSGIAVVGAGAGFVALGGAKGIAAFFMTGGRL